MNTEIESRRQEIQIDAGGSRLTGDLVVPRGATGIVVFAHGSGSSRKSSRNRAVARTLEDAGMATLLFDLLTPAEDAREQAGALLRFDVQRLAKRLVFAIDWLERESTTRDLPLGLFGASTGAAAALIAATERPSRVLAVVSRGGRPDLADRALELVRSPTRLIVGGADGVVIDLNREALQRLNCAKDLTIVPGATHLFEEPGALQQVARLAAEWFVMYLRTESRPRGASGPVRDGGGRAANASDPRTGMYGDPQREPSSPQPVGQPRPEVVPPQHEPSSPRPSETPVRVEPPYVPAPPEPGPPSPAPEVQPFREMR